MVEVAVGRGGQFERPEADVVESFIVNAVGFIRVLHQLVHRECGIVGLNNCVGYLHTRSGVNTKSSNADMFWVPSCGMTELLYY